MSKATLPEDLKSILKKQSSPRSGIISELDRSKSTLLPSIGVFIPLFDRDFKIITPVRNTACTVVIGKSLCLFELSTLLNDNLSACPYCSQNLYIDNFFIDYQAQMLLNKAQTDRLIATDSDDENSSKLTKHHFVNYIPPEGIAIVQNMQERQQALQSVILSKAKKDPENYSNCRALAVMKLLSAKNKNPDHLVTKNVLWWLGSKTIVTTVRSDQLDYYSVITLLPDKTRCWVTGGYDTERAVKPTAKSRCFEIRLSDLLKDNEIKALPKPDLPQPLLMHAAIAVKKKIYVCGGGSATELSSATYCIDYDDQSSEQSWTVLQDMPEQLQGHALFQVGAIENKIFCVGGYKFSPISGDSKEKPKVVPNENIYFYSIPVNAWIQVNFTEKSVKMEGKMWPAVSAIGDRTAIVFGGMNWKLDCSASRSYVLDFNNEVAKCELYETVIRDPKAGYRFIDSCVSVDQQNNDIYVMITRDGSQSSGNSVLLSKVHNFNRTDKNTREKVLLFNSEFRGETEIDIY